MDNGAQPAIATTVNYSLQPVVKFNGDNWSAFQAAFENYARQQDFFNMLGDDGRAEPDANPERWRRQMAQATTALVSGWVSEKILAIFRLNNTDNAHVIWGRLQQHYSNVTDIPQLHLRDRAERLKQGSEPLMDWLGALTSRVSDLAASGFNCDDTYRKQLVRHNCNSKFRPVIQQILLANPRCTYEEFLMSLLEAANDIEEPNRGNDRGYFSQ